MPRPSCKILNPAQIVQCWKLLKLSNWSVHGLSRKYDMTPYCLEKNLSKTVIEARDLEL